MKLRPYQEKAVNDVWSWVRKSSEPCLVEAATGAGKSFIIAALAHMVQTKWKRKVLCVVPSAELVQQNYEKYLLTGMPASIYSASIRKCLRHNVVFATPMSIKKVVLKNIGMVILDEAHNTTPTIKSIVSAHKEVEPRVRVVGLTATPYRLGTGYIYAEDMVKRCVVEKTIKPYYKALVSVIPAYKLLTDGYLTPPVVGQINSGSYDVSGLQLNSMGKYTADSVDRAFVGHGRKTSGIIEDVVAQSRDRRGVMIFASTVKHAEECMASLPPELSVLITGSTPKGERKRIIAAIKAQQIKYIVNVAVLTTGFDAPHIDVIALLRATESVGLLQQIIGRGLRVYEGKNDVLILDYAGNIDKHCPDGDVFDPEITVRKQGISEPVDVMCPDCGHQNSFSLRQNPDGYQMDDEAYWVDLMGNRVKTDDGKHYIPGHYGRRCCGLTVDGVRCSYRWDAKECPECGEDNDIAARHCHKCKKEIVDPNKKLIRDFRAKKRDPYQWQTDEVLEVNEQKTVSRKGRKMLRVEFTTPYRTVTLFLVQGCYSSKIKAYKEVRGKVNTITYRKDAESGFYEVRKYNEIPDMVECLR